MPESADIVVIGAGVVGCSIAYYLAREGVKAALLEREAIGSGASAHATGSLSLLGAEFSPGASFEMARASYARVPGAGSRNWKPPRAWICSTSAVHPCGSPWTTRRPTLIRGLMAWQQPYVNMRWDRRQARSAPSSLACPTAIVGAVYEDESAQLDSYRFNLATGPAEPNSRGV